jgi:hypothetical protein
VLVDEEQGITYSFQYTSQNMEDLQEYLRLEAPRLRQEVSDRYPNKFVAFRTLLEIV